MDRRGHSRLVAARWQVIPLELLKMEVGYAVLASITIGAIVGALSGGVVLGG